MVPNPERLVTYVENPGTPDAKLVICDYHNPDIFAPQEEPQAALPLHVNYEAEDLPIQDAVVVRACSPPPASSAAVAAPGSPSVTNNVLEHLLSSPETRTSRKRARTSESPATGVELSTQELEAMID